MTNMNSKFSVENISDNDAPYYVALENGTERLLSKGYDLSAVMKEANQKTSGLTPTSPNYENSDIAALTGN